MVGWNEFPKSTFHHQEPKVNDMAKKTGTKEWAETNVNIQLGCEHGCRYCYARYGAVKRYKLCTAEQWLDPVIVRSKVKRSFLKRSGVIMFPSTHDVTMLNLSESICVLSKLLDVGNEVLLVSKPHLNCIEAICDSFQGYRKQLRFRFTIGSMDQQILDFWEPNAPCYNERLQCLMLAYSQRYRTSVSCEPLLEPGLNKVIRLFEELKPYITDSLWFGKLRAFDKRVDMDNVTSEEEEKFVKPLKNAQSDEAIWALYNHYNKLQKEQLVRWKDSIREVIDK